MKRAIYAGSFDPITRGHLSIVESGLVAFDHLIIAVLNNPDKKCLFTVEERIELIRESCEEVGVMDRVTVDAFDGLLIDYAQTQGVHVILRGLRAVADFEYELQMASMNRHLNPEVETVFIMANEAYFYVASNLIKEVKRLGGDISALVPNAVASKLAAKLGT